MVKATPTPRESPHVGTTLASSLPISYPLHHAQRGTMASYRLAAVLGSRPLFHPASPHLTPEGGAQGSDPHLELVFSAITNATLNSGTVKDKLPLHSRNTAMPIVKGMEDKRLLATEVLCVRCVFVHEHTVSANAYELKAVEMTPDSFLPCQYH